LEFAIQFAHDGAVPGLDKVHLHVRCFAVWELERVVVRPSFSWLASAVL